MRKILKVQRYDRETQKTFWQSFEYESGREHVTAADMLRELNCRSPLVDMDGTPASEIKWECNCLQKKCGSCAMLVNGLPMLACDANLEDDPRETIELAPLSKFPVVEDLIVDRKILFDNLKKMQIWLDGQADGKEPEETMEASKCLQCGCCLEICISFTPEDEFVGTTGMVSMARLLSKTPQNRNQRIKEAYQKYYDQDCSHFNACHGICPAGMDTAHLAVHSKAAVLLNNGGAEI